MLLIFLGLRNGTEKKTAQPAGQVPAERSDDRGTSKNRDPRRLARCAVARTRETTTGRRIRTRGDAGKEKGSRSCRRWGELLPYLIRAQRSGFGTSCRIFFRNAVLVGGDECFAGSEQRPLSSPICISAAISEFDADRGKSAPVRNLLDHLGGYA